MKIQKKWALAPLALLGAPAFAEVDAAVSGAFATLTSDLGSYLGFVLPVVVAVALGFISIKWVKRFMNKAS